MTPAVPVPPVAQAIIRGLWLCFWLTVLSMVVWMTLGPLPPTGTRLPLVVAGIITVPVWFLYGRLAVWVRQVSRQSSEPQDLRAVARWRVALLVLYVLSAVGTAMDTTSPLASRVGMTVASVAIAVCVWHFRAVMLAVQATGTPEPAPTASPVAEALPRWTWTVRAAQAGQLIYLLGADPSFSVGGLASNVMISAAIAGLLELLLRFARSRAGVQAA